MGHHLLISLPTRRAKITYQL